MKRDILADFKKDTAGHTMRVHRDDGGYRHIEFSRNGSFDCRFYLVTWPGYLSIVGDCGDYTFKRVDDMFTFFRRDELSINPSYWQEKLCAGADGSGGMAISEKFSIEKFKAEVGDWFNSKYPKGEGCRKERREAWDDVKTNIFNFAEDEYSAVQAIREFDSSVLSFDDFWECDLTEWRRSYIWCLYAIVWGISVYDAHKKAAVDAKALEELAIGIDSEGGSHD